jgi:dihydrofolate reductase
MGTPRLHDLAIIAAMTDKHVIGIDGTLPWHLTEELKLFKKLTQGSTVIMGRRTYESIGTPLEDRKMIVLSRSVPQINGVSVCKSIMEALTLGMTAKMPIFILGGKEVYLRTLPIASKLHISWIKRSYHGNVYFPDFNLSEWKECERQNFEGFVYVKYIRREL